MSTPFSIQRSLPAIICVVVGSFAVADAAHEIRAITDPTTRIVAEMMTVVGSRTLELVQQELTQGVRDNPEEIRAFRVLFNQSQSVSDVADMLGTFEFVDKIVLKQYEPVQNDVWTHSVSDFEMYKGSAEERLKFFERRFAIQRLAVEMMNPKDVPMYPPVAMEVYGIEGFATYEAMKALADKRSSSILDIRDLGGQRLWGRISRAMSVFQAREIPELLLP